MLIILLKVLVALNTKLRPAKQKTTKMKRKRRWWWWKIFGFFCFLPDSDFCFCFLFFFIWFLANKLMFFNKMMLCFNTSTEQRWHYGRNWSPSSSSSICNNNRLQYWESTTTCDFRQSITAFSKKKKKN